MSLIENRFLCPHCRQKLACEDGYTGWQIQCPACRGPVIVPQRAVAVRASPPTPPGQAQPSSLGKEIGGFVSRVASVGLFGVIAAAAGGVVSTFLVIGGCAVGMCGNLRLGNGMQQMSVIGGVAVFFILLKGMMDSISD
ncbi:MAG: hypothetical protein ABMA26_18975 [Limisphaerales bacterium]